MSLSTAGFVVSIVLKHEPAASCSVGKEFRDENTTFGELCGGIYLQAVSGMAVLVLMNSSSLPHSRLLLLAHGRQLHAAGHQTRLAS